MRYLERGLSGPIEKRSREERVAARDLVAMIRNLQGRLTTAQYYLALALGLYVLLAGGLLVSSKFLPYVTDNNESFSMFIQARNMVQFGLGYTAGLSDESLAMRQAGHPYVYTHEGNFPRFPVYLLMLLGVRMIEWQIGLHALVLGTSTIYLCFRFFSKVAGPLFALIACVVLTTDYLPFLQWEVNIFRVWHGLFFFLSLVCVQSMNDVDRRKVGLLLFSVFVGMFYFEMVFGIFTMIVCICYAFFTYWNRRYLVLRVVLNSAAGAATAMCGLLAQSIAYLGWTVAWRDIQLTLLSRNFYQQTLGQVGESNVLEFFLKHHIVYWRDVPDTSGYLSIWHFLYVAGAPTLRAYTPYLVLAVWILTGAWVVRWALRAGAVMRFRKTPFSRGKVTPWVAGGRTLLVIICVAVSLVLGFLEFDLRDLLQLGNPSVIKVPILHLALDFPQQFRRMVAPLWLEAIRDYFGDRLLLAGLMGSIALAAVVVLKGGRRYLRSLNNRSFVEIFRYLAACCAAFLFTYVVSPGYLWAGYLGWYAPLAVFIVDVWIALFFYGLVVLVKASSREVAVGFGRITSGIISRSALSTISIPLFAFALSLFLLALGSVYWVRLQTVYIGTLPPTSFLFLRGLGQGEYKGSTFVSNVYSAPITYFTGNWAYLDHIVSEDVFLLRSGKTTQVIDGEYLWEADRESNNDYLHPRYYMCIVSQSLTMAADLVALHSRGRLSNCSSQPLVRDAQRGIGPFSNTLVASDPSPRDMWAIVKLDPSIRFTRLH